MASWQTYLRRGVAFQFVAILTFILRRMTLQPTQGYLIFGPLVIVGLGLFAYCLYALYIRKRAVDTLITTGVFRYTRHPMYVAVALMDVACWFAPITTFSIVTAVVFYASLSMAGYWQEKETLARFGAEAEAYYQRTPHLFIW